MPKYSAVSKSRSESPGRFARFLRVTFPGGWSFFGITCTGGIYIVFMMLVSLIAVRSGSNALYVILATLISMLIISSIISRHALKQLSLTLRTPDRIFAGDRVPTRVSVTNRKRFFPSLAIAVEENSPNVQSIQIDPAHGRRMTYFPILRAGETRSEQLVQTFPQRGHCRQTLRVSTRFPFGFFNRCDPLPSQKLLIYPALGEIPELFRSQDIFSGHMESRERSDGNGFYSIREYRDGESVRAIDWKATAKTRRLMAREFAREREMHCLLFLDTFVPSLENDEPFEKAVSLTAGLAAHFLKKGAFVELLTQEEHIPAGIGERHLYRILEALAVTQLQTTLDLFNRKTKHDGGGNDSATRLPKKRPLPDVQRILSARSFKIILTPRHPESFPVNIRRAAHIIPFEPLESLDSSDKDGQQDAAVKQA